MCLQRPLIKYIIILGCHHLSCLPGRIVTSCGAKKEGVSSVNKKVWQISRPENQETNKMMIRLEGKFSGGLTYACSWKSLILYIFHSDAYQTACFVFSGRIVSID